MNLFSSNTLTTVENTIKTDTQAVLKKLDVLAGAVQSGGVSSEFLNILSILQPIITVVEADYPQYASTISWAENILKNALSATRTVAPIAPIIPDTIKTN